MRGKVQCFNFLLTTKSEVVVGCCALGAACLHLDIGFRNLLTFVFMDKDGNPFTIEEKFVNGERLDKWIVRMNDEKRWSRTKIARELAARGL